jgi:NNP family nitrate/nitrite transporter-like MFS transporter
MIMTITASQRRESEHAASFRPYAMLGMVTVGFALTFWAWALLSPLGAHFKRSAR